MLNVIWGAMIVGGVIMAAFSGKLSYVTSDVIESASGAVSLCITMLGLVSMWSGVMRVAEASGFVSGLTKAMLPLLHFLFPDIPKKHKALSHIGTNFVANFLGLNWAATPAGLLAMEEMQVLNRYRSSASKSMCMFMAINMSSVQLISVNMIAYRQSFGSLSPTEVIGPAILATCVSTLFAVVLTKFFERIC